MAEVKWIKLNVGMFDGNSFKKIKKAKIGGESFRDKLTAVWFELLDFAGKCNAGGQLIESPEIPFSNIEDIAIMIDREAEELNLCMQYYISNRMITVIDDVYMLTNWARYQNEDGLEKIREQNRLRQAKFKAKRRLLPQGNVSGNVTVTQGNATEEDIDKEIDIDTDLEGEIERDSSPLPTLQQIKNYVTEHNLNVDPDRFFSYYSKTNWKTTKGNPVNWQDKLQEWHDTEHQKQDNKPQKSSNPFLNALKNGDV